MATLPTRCARPTLGARKTSTYTVLGFAGYALASVVCALLAAAWELTLADRVAALLVPPIAFVIVITILRLRLGYELIVFYQTASVAIVSATLASAFVGAQPVRVFDLVTIGVGIFLVLGRVGCFSVACCHGRPARRGVTYGPQHVAVGLWARWAHRPLWPVQLVEAAVSLVLVVVALVVGWSAPGLPALIYIVGYTSTRFVLELVRGDSARPHFLGVSEAQWTAIAILIACAIWRPGAATIAVAAAVAVFGGVLVARRQPRRMLQPAHLREIDRACAAAVADGAKHETSLGVAITYHVLPDGRADWILSSTNPTWSIAIARRIAGALWTELEIVEGRMAPVIHVLEPGYS